MEPAGRIEPPTYWLWIRMNGKQ